MARPHIAHSTPNNQEENRSDGFGLSQHYSQPSECDYGGALPAASIRAGIPFHFRTYCSTAAACSARMEEPVMCPPCHRPQRRLSGLHRAACTAADLQRPPRLTHSLMAHAFLTTAYGSATVPIPVTKHHRFASLTSFLSRVPSWPFIASLHVLQNSSNSLP